MGNSEVWGIKTGGSSVAEATKITHVIEQWMKMDARRRALIVSAPAGITDMLIAWVLPYGANDPRLTDKARDFQASFGSKDLLWDAICRRFANIARDLGLNLDIHAMFKQIRLRAHRLAQFRRHAARYDYVVSRGEWVNAQIVAAAGGYVFVDAESFLVVKKNGKWDEATTKRLAERMRLAQMVRDTVIVVGGFYGRSRWLRSRIRLLSRGGSDVTGAIVSALIGATTYENCTDQDGIKSADPRIVPHAHVNPYMSHRETRELTFMGAGVLHEDTVQICRQAGIKIHLRNTASPEKEGTWIVKELPQGLARPPVTGVTAKNGFSAILVEKFGLNDIVGIQGKMERVFTRWGISINSSATIDSLTFISNTAEFMEYQREIIAELTSRFGVVPMVQHDIALVCTVGEGMRDRIGTSAAVDEALRDRAINILFEQSGMAQMNLTRAVNAAFAVAAVQAVHDKFFPD